ncbi:hypothetical protein [Nonlabens sp.]|uniref:hypothetical protein n=1 Tax=Nonlabens sp. TaxID=1888209 RepID=UPI003F699D5B
MKYLLCTIAVFTGMITSGQTNENVSDHKVKTLISQDSLTCEAIQENAAVMAARKEFIYVNYGLMANPMTSAPDFLALMKSKYNISFESKGCTMTPQEMCYARAMNKEIVNEYGTEFIKTEYQNYLHTIEKE